MESSGGPISLADILNKGTLLRKVNMDRLVVQSSEYIDNWRRSPGGTPIRSAGPTSTGPVTTQDMIALALKKKFETMKKITSPDNSPNKENELENGNWEEGNTPIKPSRRISEAKEVPSSPFLKPAVPSGRVPLAKRNQH